MKLAPSLAALSLVALPFVAGCNADKTSLPSAEAASSEAPSKSPSSTDAVRASAADAPRAATTQDGFAQRTFGAPIGPGDVTTLDAIVAEPAKFAQKTIKTEGTVTAVCQHMGCWMEIGADDKLAHVKMAGHSFFVPKTATGHHAIVEGQLSDAGGSGGACMHEGKDSCAGNADAKVQLEATGVQFID